MRPAVITSGGPWTSVVTNGVGQRFAVDLYACALFAEGDHGPVSGEDQQPSDLGYVLVGEHDRAVGADPKRFSPGSSQ